MKISLSFPLFIFSFKVTEGWISTNGRFANRLCASGAALKSALNDFNVVLRPSESPEAFDNSKIGAARVHRYARDSDDSEAEYIMWYHGRSIGFDGESKLPPLSTGRIGRAISRNGLHWVREEVGRASEDMKGVSLGLNQESWWGFDTAHVGLGQVLLPMSTPAVMTEVSNCPDSFSFFIQRRNILTVNIVLGWSIPDVLHGWKLRRNANGSILG